MSPVPNAYGRFYEQGMARSDRGFLLREDDWAYIQYGENGVKGIELYNVKKDPHQYTSLAKDPAHQKTVTRFKAQMEAKLRSIRDNDLKRN